MQIAAELLLKLSDSIDAVRMHLSTLDRRELDALALKLAPSMTAGTAEMVMLILLHREIEARKRQDDNVMPFQLPTS